MKKYKIMKNFNARIMFVLLSNDCQMNKQKILNLNKLICLVVAHIFS